MSTAHTAVSTKATIALVPAHNEAERIAETVRAIASIRHIDRVLVIDDGSTDKTAERASAAGAEVLALPTNRGKGGALAAGIEHVAAEADTLVFLDADLGESATQAVALLEPILSGRADMAIAMLPKPPGSGGFGLVKRLARYGIRALTGLTPEAPLSGQRVLSQNAWHAVQPLASGFGVEVGLTVRAIWAGLTVVEVPTSMSHAATGKSLAGFMHRGRQFLAVATTLIGLTVEAARRRLPPQGPTLQ